jgi:hypothetical protein
MRQHKFRRADAAQGRMGSLDAFEHIHHPSAAAFATAAKLSRSFCPAGTRRIAWPIEAAAPSGSARSLSSSISGWRLISKLFLSLQGVCAGILRNASARIAERSFQLFAPVVDVSILSRFIPSERMGARLALDWHAVSARVPRPGDLLHAPHHALLSWRLCRGGLW